MSNTTVTLRRFGISALVVGTVAAGVPLLVGSASAQDPITDLIAASASPSASRSATPTSSSSASATPTATISSSASPSASSSTSATPTATMSSSSSPSATSTATTGNQPATPPGCERAAEVVLGRDTINATGSAPVSATGTPNSVIEVYAYSRPSTQYRLVRTGTTDASGKVSFNDLKPPTNTRLYAQQRGCAIGQSKVLNVRTQISLNVVRNGARDYTFSGRALPARPGGLIVSLYRVTPSGQQILAAQARASATTGVYTINRKFTGSGRFGFVVRTGQDLQNAPGASNVRSLLVY